MTASFSFSVSRPCGCGAAMRCRRRLQSFTLTLIHISLLLCTGAPRPGEGCAAAEEQQQQQQQRGTSADTLMLCRACGHELANGADISFVPSRLALSSRNHTLPGGRRVNVQLFENPHGLRFEVITFRKADVAQHWPADKHFSWFPGFSWTAATCPRCQTHLGWAFQPSVWPDTITQSKFEESEQTFLALITHRLLSEDFASSLLMTPKSFTS